METRLVYCSTSRGKIYPEKFCHEYRKPNATRTCELEEKEEKDVHAWFAMQWGEVIIPFP
jgi:hypothetical protein